MCGVLGVVGGVSGVCCVWFVVGFVWFVFAVGFGLLECGVCGCSVCGLLTWLRCDCRCGGWACDRVMSHFWMWACLCGRVFVGVSLWERRVGNVFRSRCSRDE